MTQLAATPEPPYFAVIFTSRRSDGDDEHYSRTADEMEKLAARVPGFLGIDSARGADRVGITVSYWASLEAISVWRRDVDHLAAQKLGRDRWYDAYELRICRVERAYGFTR